MRKIAFLTLLAVLFLAGCSGGWRGYEKEDLSRYIVPGSFPAITPAESVEPTEDEIDARIEELLLEAAVFVVSDKPYAEGMMVTLNMDVTVSGEVCEPLSGEITVWHTDRLDTVKKAVCAAVVGKKAGQSVNAKIAIPAGYAEGINSGTVAEYRISVLAVRESDIPALTDENAGRVMPGCTSAEQVREKIRAQLADTTLINESLRYDAWNEYFASSTLVKVPYEAYMSFYSALIQPYKSLAELKEISLESYVRNYCGMELDELEAALSEKALNKTKDALLVHQTAKTLSLTYSYADLDAYAESQIRLGDGDFENAEDYIEYFGRDNVIIEVLREKIMDYYTE